MCFGGILLVDGVAPRTSVLVLATQRTACLLSARKFFLIHLHLVLSLENQETKVMPRNSLRRAGVAVKSEAIIVVVQIPLGHVAMSEPANIVFSSWLQAQWAGMIWHFLTLVVGTVSLDNQVLPCPCYKYSDLDD